ncbi:MAG: hypothetical protein B7X80_09600 [Sulfurovum sp. 17-42-90]|nr:MAG: hypothetical protein B7X80_09600 [Sulfurovum sp. 17-42-90]
MHKEYVSRAGYVAAVMVVVLAFVTVLLKERGVVENITPLVLYLCVVVVFVVMFAFELFDNHTYRQSHRLSTLNTPFSFHHTNRVKSVILRFAALLLPLLIAYGIVHGLAWLELGWVRVQSHVLVFYTYALLLFVGVAPVYLSITLRYRGDKKYEFNDYAMLTMVGLRAVYFRVTKQQTFAFYRNRRVKKVLLVYVVNFFFISLMASFLVNEQREFALAVHKMLQEGYGEQHWFLQVKNNYSLLFHLLFMIDVSLAMIGYAFASRWVGNRTKSVDMSITGWMVALACYPPFNNLLSMGMLSYTNKDTHTLIVSDVGIAIVMVLLLFAYGIYVWSTIALGFKFSNLTNRGIVTTGPYAYVRHPAYASKNTAWIIDSTFVFTNIWATILFFSWTIVYILRALTEERHLHKDKVYQVYADKVRYRFIPKVI